MKMLEKRERLLVTFSDTVDAMLMEKAAAREELGGRLIPVPPAIRAGCGLCFMTEPSEEGRVRQLIGQRKLRVEELVRLYL